MSAELPLSRSFLSIFCVVAIVTTALFINVESLFAKDADVSAVEPSTVEESKAESASPAAEKAKVESAVPVVEGAKVESAAPVAEETKAESPAPVAEEGKTESPDSIAEEAKVESAVPVAEEAKTGSPAPVVEETKTESSEAAVEKAETESSAPVVEETKAESSDPVAEVCTRIGNKLGSVTVESCQGIQFADSGARSVNGQAILMKEYPPLLERRKPIARVLLIGGTHGDEYASVSVVFRWMQTLDKHHSGLFHWHVSPLVNPDGLLLSTPSVRLNAHGVDLNRNMPTPDWYKSTATYWHQTGKDPRRNPGTDPLSEPESGWLYEEIRSFKPDAIISVHAPYGLLDYDGPPTAPSKIGYLNLKTLGAFPGSLGNFAGKQHQIPVITVELPSAGSMPEDEEISTMWMDLVRWLRHNIPKDVTLKAYAGFDERSESLLASPRLSEEEVAEIAAMPIISNHSVSNQPSSMVNVEEPVDEQ